MNLPEFLNRLQLRLNRQSNTRLLFCHVPKCGGSSIYEALSKSLNLKYPDGHIDPVYTREAISIIHDIKEPETHEFLQVTRQAILLEHVKQSKRFIAGHFTIRKNLFDLIPDEYFRFTILREPTRRLFSHFKYWYLTRGLPLLENDIKQSWEQFSNSDRGRFQANLYALYFGENSLSDLNKSCVATALDNLKLFDFVGRLEDMDQLTKTIGEVIQKEVEMVRANTTDQHDMSEEINQVFQKLFDTQLSRITELCEYDLNIYQKWFNL